jgi:hypothetical protein
MRPLRHSHIQGLRTEHLAACEENLRVPYEYREAVVLPESVLRNDDDGMPHTLDLRPVAARCGVVGAATKACDS